MEKTTARPLAIGLTVLGALARLVPHAPNFTPVGSMSLYGGARLRGWQAFVLPLALMAITDPLVGGYSFATPFVYAAFLINVCIGRMLRETSSPWRIGAACLACSAQFFLITNFAVWLQFYPHTTAGLALCYTQAIPFVGRTILGDLLYAGAIFGLDALLRRRLRPVDLIASA